MVRDSVYNEMEVLELIAKGDQRAFVLLVDHYSATIYTHVLTYLKNAAHAEEITQDILVKVWKNREDLPAVTNFPGYLYIITRNMTISAFRQKIASWDDSQHDELESDSLNPAGALEYRQFSDTVLQGIKLLPPRRQQVFTMSRFDGLSYEAIAQQLGISKSSVNQHIVEALLFLRTHLRNQLAMVLISCLLIQYKIFINFF